jgi:hypothetical protein
LFGFFVNTKIRIPDKNMIWKWGGGGGLLVCLTIWTSGGLLLNCGLAAQVGDSHGASERTGLSFCIVFSIKMQHAKRTSVPRVPLLLVICLISSAIKYMT